MGNRQAHDDASLPCCLTGILTLDREMPAEPPSSASSSTIIALTPVAFSERAVARQPPPRAVLGGPERPRPAGPGDPQPQLAAHGLKGVAVVGDAPDRAGLGQRAKCVDCLWHKADLAVGCARRGRGRAGMDVFRVRDRLIEDYREFTGSFVEIHDARISAHARHTGDPR
jgi:hypothetical protein